MQQLTIIWLDSNSTDPNSSFRSKLDEVRLFTDPDQCIEYIQSHSNELIYLIISGVLAGRTIPQIYECSNLIEIFLFCGNVAAYSVWGVDYCEKMLMFDHEDDLLARLWKNLETKFHEQAQLCLKRANEFKQKALEYKQTPCG